MIFGVLFLSARTVITPSLALNVTVPLYLELYTLANSIRFLTGVSTQPFAKLSGASSVGLVVEHVDEGVDTRMHESGVSDDRHPVLNIVVPLGFLHAVQ